MKKVLVANRGEPVVRAVKTLRRMGIATAVVYAPEDASADWLAEVDFAYRMAERLIVKGTSAYLDGALIIDVAKRQGCDAIWPAWGFLAENVEFAEAVVTAGLTWIGPTPTAMRCLGSKESSGALARKAGVPTVPEMVVSAQCSVLSTDNRVPSTEHMLQRIGFPLLLKPAFGGGGQGQAIARSADELNDAFATVERINTAQFKGGPILVQRYIENARHIEVQVVADTHRNIVVFHERECSVQRRNQKIIEESPSLVLTEAQRQLVCDYAVKIAAAAKYTSAGTCEFLFADGQFYFLEMNTRLQVEHPITEETTRWVDSSGRWRRIDLFEEMVLIAQGKHLRFSQETIRCIGHAVEARIYAEDPARDFCPSPGTITGLRFPVGDRFRVETALRGPGSVVSARYDPMLAKLIAWGETRELALSQLRLGLERTTVGGVTTNVAFLHRVATNPDFTAGTYTTGFVATHPQLLAQPIGHGGLAIAVATIALYERDRARVLARITSGQVTNVAAVLGAVPPNSGEYLCTLQGRTATLRVAEWSPDRYVVVYDGALFSLTSVRTTANELVVLLPDGATCAAGLTWHAGALDVTVDGATYQIGWVVPGSLQRRDPHAAQGGGRLVKLCVALGSVVKAGDCLYITEAMKMEARMHAAFDGVVAAVHVDVGAVIEPGQAVVTVQGEAVADDAAAVPPWTVAELGWPVDVSSIGRIVRGAIAGGDRNVLRAAREVLRRYFHGFDIPREWFDHAIRCTLGFVRDGAEDPARIADLYARCGEDTLILQELFAEEHAHATVYFIEHLGAKERRLPKGTEQLLQQLAASAGFQDLRDGRELRHMALHWLQAARYRLAAADDGLVDLLTQLLKPMSCRSTACAAVVHRLVTSPRQLHDTAARAKWREAVRDFDWGAYYAIEPPPVAKEYWDLYEQCLADPAAGIAPSTLEQMRAAVRALEQGWEIPNPWPPTPQWTEEAAQWLPRWFEGFAVRLLPVSRAAAEAGVTLFAARGPSDAPTTQLIAVGTLAATRPTVQNGAIVAVPSAETAAIEAYWMLRLYEALGLRGEANHIFLFFPESFTIPTTLSLETARRIGRRVAGFARHLQIVATEAILTIGNERQLIQIWHARDVGVLSRPPIPLHDRLPEARLIGEKAIDLRQQRLGKLLNPDRARLLFDDGKFEELFFPEVDFTGDRRLATSDAVHEPIALNVYRGAINGHEALVYAGDFRHRGGALGEREGKKLAATVVLAYVRQVPLIGIHDGAGANIKGSVASLGWAGAYFGAIAATGGYSSPEQFQSWLADHHERRYFEEVLRYFEGLSDGGTSSVVSRRSSAITKLPATGDSACPELVEGRPATPLPLIHLHLHLGAAVGMLVYGPSISSCAIMVDHPEVYRLLTGAATVERVTGEKGTNYSLGGARVHYRLSGEIDLVYRSEETAIHGARELLHLLADREGIPLSGPIQRVATIPQPEVPVSGGVILGREAIEANVDGGRFIETRDALRQAGGLLTGYARLGGQPVVLAVTATDYGMHHGRAFKKMQLAAAAAEDFGLPLIVAVGANWDRLHPVVRTEAIYQQHEMRKAIRDARVPKIGIALGPRSLERSVHEMMDLVWYVERGNETAYERQRARMLTHGVTTRFAEAMDWCADILRYLPRPWEINGVASRQSLVASNHKQSPATSDQRPATGRVLPSTDPIDRLIPELAEIIPTNLNQPYDMREVVQRVFDAGSWREFAPGDGQPLIIGLAGLNGRIVGVIADAPDVEGGAQTVVSISKFTRFHRFCSRFGFPIIEFNDSPAFRPGREQEQSGIQGEGGKSIREEVLSTIPKVAVTLRQNYGGRYIHANLVTLGAPRHGLIVAGARLGVMGADGAVGVLFAKELAAIKDPTARAERKAELIAEYERARLNPRQAIDLGYAEAIIPLAQLRTVLIHTAKNL